jgi:hypothetical protein
MFAFVVLVLLKTPDITEAILISIGMCCYTGNEEKPFQLE